MNKGGNAIYLWTLLPNPSGCDCLLEIRRVPTAYLAESGRFLPAEAGELLLNRDSCCGKPNWFDLETRCTSLPNQFLWREACLHNAMIAGNINHVSEV